MSRMDVFCDRMRWYCDHGDLGYDQGNRWQVEPHGECDCSSLVYECLWEAGFLTKPVGNLYSYTLYTGTLYRDLTKAGWRAERATGNVPRARCIVLNEGNHVGAWLGDVFAQASIDERGKASGGQAGDQTDRETNTRSWYVYSKGWDWYLYPPEDNAAPVPSGNLVHRLQIELNSQCGAGLKIDGEWGPLTKAASSAKCAILRKGDKGNMTAILQEALNRKGYQLAVDGDFGQNTLDAVTSWQARNGIEVDGEVGGDTWGVLLA